MLECIKKLYSLNKEHQQTIFDTVAYWYEKNVRKGIGVLDLNCQKENSHLRCFTPTGYEAFRHFEDEKDDLKKCVGLKM